MSSPINSNSSENTSTNNSQQQSNTSASDSTALKPANDVVDPTKDPNVTIFDNSVVTRDIGWNDVKIDFNYGARVRLPAKSNFHVRITDIYTNTILYDKETPVGETDIVLSTEKKYYVKFTIELWKPEDPSDIYSYTLNLENENVLFKLPQGVLGDTLAWFPYIEVFRKKHNCNAYVIMREDFVDLLKPNYPDINFVTDKTYKPDNCLATYYMGIYFPASNRTMQPVDFRQVGLHISASYLLDLPHTEVITKFYTENLERNIEEPYVCIAVQATTQSKCWNNAAGWIETVTYLKKLGYRVLCIDRDRVYGDGRFWNAIPHGAEDFTGNIPIKERVRLLAHADFFIGLPSGLSWVANSSGCPVIMIAGFSLPNTEFSTPYRIINYNVCNGCWNYDEFKHDNYGWCPKHGGTSQEFQCTRLISSGYVINNIDQLMKDHGYKSVDGKIIHEK